MGIFNRAAFESRRKLATKVVKASIGDVTLRRISALDLMELREQFSEVITKPQQIKFSYSLLARSIIDEAGNVFLTPKEVEDTFPINDVLSLGTEAINLSGISASREGIEDRRKNSRASRKR
jgi:hypothetical protein